MQIKNIYKPLKQVIMEGYKDPQAIYNKAIEEGKSESIALLEGLQAMSGVEINAWMYTMTSVTYNSEKSRCYHVEHECGEIDFTRREAKNLVELGYVDGGIYDGISMYRG